MPARTNNRMAPARLGLVALAASALPLGSIHCTETMPDPAPVDEQEPPITVSFSADIQPIFDAYCVRCHVFGSFANQSGIPLRLVEDVSYNLLVNQPSVQRPELVLVVPGDPESSLLYLKMSQEDPPVGLQMPWDGERGGLVPTAEEIELVRVWIEEGANEN